MLKLALWIALTDEVESAANAGRLDISLWWPLALGFAVLVLGIVAAYAGWGRPKDSV